MSPSLFASHAPSRVARALPRFGERVRGALVRLLQVGVVLGLASLLGWFGWSVYGFVLHSGFFDLQQMEVEFAEAPPGLDAPVRLEHGLRGLLEREGLAGGNLIQLEAEKVEQVLTRVPWVRSASVNKNYPDSLEISIQPRRIAALVLHDPILAVDAEGVVVEALTTRHRLAAGFPYLTGLEIQGAALGKALNSESLTKSLDLLSCLKEGNLPLYADVSEVHCDPDSNLVLVLKGGTEIRFGAENPILKMPNLETFIARQGRPSEYVYVDLRVEGQIAFLSRKRAAAMGEAARR